MRRETAVGEIQTTSKSRDEVGVVFLGVASPLAIISHSALEGSGVVVDVDEFFVAEVDVDAKTPEELQPSGFAPLPRDYEVEPDFQVRELWRS